MTIEHPTALYEWIRHVHQPANVNETHATEKHTNDGLNQKVAVGMTKLFSGMPTFWLILLWIVLWIVLNLTVTRFDPLPFPLLLALASIPQLPLMIVIMVGQSVLSRHQELQAEEAFATTQHSFHDIEQIMLHLTAQDEAILHILARVEQLPTPRKKTEKLP